MFKPHNIFNNNLTHSSNKCPNHRFSKEEPKEDSEEDSKVKEEDLAVEEDEVMIQSSATRAGYLGITRGSTLMCSSHTVQLVTIMSKVALS